LRWNKDNLLISSVSSFYNYPLNAKESSPLAVKGILDLRKLSYADHFIISSTEHGSFTGKDVASKMILLQGNYKPDYYGNVPSYWTDYPPESVKT